MKVCKRCGESKEPACFPVNRASPDGLYRLCRACNAAVLAERNCSKAYKAKRRASRNTDDERAKARAAYAKNPQRYVDYQRAYAKRSPAEVNAKNAERRASARRTLTASREAIAAVYARATHLTQLTGVRHHVDHIVPLKGANVSGLHVPWNLQCLPARDNIAKHNRF